MRKLCVPLLLAASLPAAAADRELVIYQQGRLLTTQDAPVTDVKPLTFRIYTRVDGTTSDVAWQETYDVRFSANGTYAVGLGDPANNKLRLLGSQVAGDRWLGITVDSVELQPRLRLGAVASAIDAANLEGHPAADFLLRTEDAANALKLGGKAADLFALKTDDAPNALKFGGKLPAEFALKNEVSTNALQLGGHPADDFQLKADPAANALKLGGKLAEDFALKTDVPSDYLGKTATAVNASKLENLAASAFLKSGLTTTQTGGLSLDGAASFASASLGFVKLGARTTEPFVCDSNGAGGLYWNATKKRFFACDGVAWTDFAGVGDTPASCAEILRRQPTSASGTYTIDPDGAGALASITVYCDMTTSGGGWTLTLRDRLNDGSVVRSTQIAWAPNTEGTATGSGDYLIAANMLAAIPRAQQQYQYLAVATGTGSITGQYIVCRQDDPITKNGSPANASCTYQDNSVRTEMARGISFHDSGCKNVAFWADGLNPGTWWQGSLFGETPNSSCSGGWTTTFPNALGNAPFASGIVRTSDYATWIYMR